MRARVCEREKEGYRVAAVELGGDGHMPDGRRAPHRVVAHLWGRSGLED